MKMLTKTAIGMLLCLLLPMPTLKAQHGDGLDDVLQHLPMATVVVLKAGGVDNMYTWGQTLGCAAVAYTVGSGVTYTLKHTVSEERPDHSDCRSFPSGHAMYAFAGASALRHEYGHVSPWIAVGGYTVATLTAVDRVRRDRHHWYDVCAGAAIGTVATEATYYLSRRWLRKRSAEVGFTGNTLTLVCRW